MLCDYYIKATLCGNTNSDPKGAAYSKQFNVSAPGLRNMDKVFILNSPIISQYYFFVVTGHEYYIARLPTDPI